MLKIVNLVKKFNDATALDNINIDVKKGDRIVIIGPSGCGKSTLLRCINGLETPTSGEIIYNGKNIKNFNQNVIRQKIGMVFQKFNLFNHITVKENITLAPIKLKLLTKEKAEDKAAKLLDFIKLSDKIDQYPSKLSGGEQQRVAIIRSLMLSPELLLFSIFLSKLSSGDICSFNSLLSDSCLRLLSNFSSFLNHMAPGFVNTKYIATT